MRDPRDPYPDRHAAGQALAQLAALQRYAGRDDVCLLALPRGGVPVAYELAQALRLALDLMLVRKLGTPGQEELAMGAIAMGDIVVRNESVIRSLNIDQRTVIKKIEQEAGELARRNLAYRDDRPPPDLKGKTVILVDDGLATGSTMRAAVRASATAARAVVIAVPVGPADVLLALQAEPHVEAVICPWTPSPFGGVGRWYADFDQVSDEQVRTLLRKAWHRSG